MIKQLTLILLTATFLGCLTSTETVTASDPIITAVTSAAHPLSIKKIDAEITVNGIEDEAVWKDATCLTDFRLYWNPEAPQPTELRLFHNGTDLCFLYKVTDSDIIRATMINEEMDIADEDRIEFGFSPEDPTLPYYFFEIDSMGRVLDYASRYYRYFDDTWDCAGLETLGRDTPDGYLVEGKFSLQSLREMGALRPDGKMLAGFFRGDYFTHPDPELNHVWISWIYSQTKEPDFHIRSAFGTVELEP